MGEDKQTTDSIAPRAAKGKQFKLGEGGLTVSWKMVAACLVVLVGGGGSISAFTLASEQYVNEVIAEHAVETETKQVARGQELDKAIGENRAMLEQHGKMIGEVQLDMKAFQSVQHQQYARDEARRVTEGIASRRMREEAYDRLVDLNLRRLARGEDPCANLACSN